MSHDDFAADLKRIINKHSEDSGANTPDFILAAYLISCLEAFGEATKGRDEWYGHFHPEKQTPTITLAD